MPGLRSLIPRMVSKEETARMYTAFMVIISLMPLASTALMNNLYAATMDDPWPGMIFAVVATVLALPFFTQW